jgi:DNA primase
VLVFDADAGGNTGVDRALEVFVGENVELRIATLPEGLDPCDLLVQQGAEPFRAVLEKSVDVLEFKLNRVWEAEANAGVEGRRRAMDAVLGVLALAPVMPGQEAALKRELMVNRIAQRLALKEETVWARLEELRDKRRSSKKNLEAEAQDGGGARKALASPHERQLLEVLLAEPALVPLAAAEVASGEIEHPGLRQLLEGLYRLQAEGLTPDLDNLRPRIENPRLSEYALGMQEVGRLNADRAAWLRQILAVFRQRRQLPAKQELQNQLHAASDHAAAVALLRQLQNRSGDMGPGASPTGGART